MYLFFDTETTGMFDFKSDPRAPHQPHICQMAAILCDKERRIVGQFEFLVKPEGWTIPPELTAIHGIAYKMCEDNGLPLSTVLGTLVMLQLRADWIIAHNIDFDIRMLKRSDATFIGGVGKTRCTMKESTDLCKLPGGRGGGYKYPKLVEAYKTLVGKDPLTAHNAMADTRMCMEVFWAIEDAKQASDAAKA